MFGFFKRRPRVSPVIEALVTPDPAPEYSAADRADGLPRRVPGSTLTPAECEKFEAWMADLAAPITGAIPDREQIVQDPSAPYDDVEMEAFAPGSLADQAAAFLANRAGGAA